MRSAEEIFSKVNGFSLIENNVNISLTKNDIYRAMKEYAMQYIKGKDCIICKNNHKDKDIDPCYTCLQLTFKPNFKLP